MKSKAPTGIFPPPGFVTPAGKIEYRRIVALLCRLNTPLWPLDRPILGVYASALAEIADMSARLRAEGELLRAPSGRLYRNPLGRALRMKERTRDTFAAFLFGNLRSRSRR